MDIRSNSWTSLRVLIITSCFGALDKSSSDVNSPLVVKLQYFFFFKLAGAPLRSEGVRKWLITSPWG